MSKGRAVLIHSAERMLPSSSNTLLKALEEPPPRTIIVLATSALQKILPTIFSSQTIRIPAISQAPALDLDLLLQAPSYRAIHAFTEELAATIEEERSTLEKELLAAHPKEDLTASARHEIEAEIEAALTLWSQQRAQKILQEAYLVLRSRENPSPDLSKSLLQALKAIERGSDLKRIFPIFCSGSLSLSDSGE